jgi:hypothetical protein
MAARDQIERTKRGTIERDLLKRNLCDRPEDTCAQKPVIADDRLPVELEESFMFLATAYLDERNVGQLDAAIAEHCH